MILKATLSAASFLSLAKPTSLIATAFSMTRRSGCTNPVLWPIFVHEKHRQPFKNAGTQLFGSRRGQSTSSRTATLVRMMSGSDESYLPPVTHINKAQMQEILETVSNIGREESGYVVIDVRGEDEIAMTGKIHEAALTLPLPYIMEKRALAMEEDDFLESFGFEKPGLDETVVFSCKAGMRSKVAAQVAAMEGYTDLINYTGGADEWFS